MDKLSQTKKIGALGVVLVMIVITHLASPIYAQSNAQVEKTVKCLKNRPGDIGNTQALTWHDPPTPQSLPKKLFGEFVSGSTVYAVACRGSGVGRICSTGNTTLDAELFTGGTDIKQAGAGTINVTFDKPKQEVDVTGIINVDAVVGGTAQPEGSYDFFGVEVKQKVDMNISGQGALQQASFDFAQKDGKDCARLSWTHYDPYGVVFDSVSLEPMGGVAVTIHDETGKPLENNPVLLNGKPTDEGGVYNYLVQPGKYKLTFQVPKGYEFIKNPPAHPNMMAVYDFIDENDAKSHCTIYEPDEVIDEKANMPECRNIPLHPVSANPLSKAPVSIEYDLVKDDENQSYIINGKVSHALATIQAYQVVSPNQKINIAMTEANRSGFYKLTIPIDKVLPEAPVEVEFKKSVLMNPTTPVSKNVLERITEALQKLVIKDVFAQSTQLKLSIDPIPTYIEGYAVDESQQIIPRAVVQIRLKNGGSLYYETTADQNGYFFIPPANLPSSALNLEFYLAFVKENGQRVPYKIYEFTQANKYYFAQEGINLLTGTKNGKTPLPQDPKNTKLDISHAGESNSSSNRSGSGQNNSNSTNTTATVGSNKTNTSQQLILIISAVLMLLLLGAGAVFVFIKKKNSQPQF